MSIPVLIHLPHSAVSIPDNCRKDILLKDKELQKELLLLTDRYTDELFSFDGITIHRNEYSRLVFDPERFRNDEDEIMARFGMGAIYSCTQDGVPMRKLTGEKREEMMREFYDPYHQELERKTQQILDDYGKCLIIDGHSFPEKPLKFEADQNPERPDICLGTCNFHTPEVLVIGMEEFIRKHEMTVKRNSPFSGTLVPMKYYRKDERVSSVMIEVNRRLYMNENNGAKLSSFDAAKDFIFGLLQRTIEIYEG